MEQPQNRLSMLVGKCAKQVCVEVGCGLGDFASAILSHRPQHLLLIDPLKVQPADVYQDPRDYTGADYECLYRGLVTRYSTTPNVTIARHLSYAVVGTVAPQSVGFVYLDANPAYETVREDLYNWWLKVKPGGWLCGSGYGKPSVRRAVGEFAEDLGRGPDLLTVEDEHYGFQR
jgi:hypothetical protein